MLSIIMYPFLDFSKLLSGTLAVTGKFEGSIFCSIKHHDMEAYGE
jgi:hypothetical protein